MQHKKDIIDRIKLVRWRYAGTRGKALFSSKLGISPSTYNYYEKDRIPPIEILWKICELTGCDLNWLVSGQQKGEFLDEKNADSNPLMAKIKARIRKDAKFSPALKAFLDLYDQKVHAENSLKGSSASGHADPHKSWLPVLGRTAAGLVHYWPDTQRPDITELSSLIEKHTLNVEKQRVSPKVTVEPLSTAVPPLEPDRISLIQLRESTSEGVCEFIECPQALQRYPDAFALRVDGDSMSPNINDGDLVILSPSVLSRNTVAAVVQIKNQIGVTCKIYREQDNDVHLIPTNEKYDHKIIARDQIEWALAVLWRIRF